MGTFSRRVARFAVAAAGLSAAMTMLTGCTPEGLKVFGETQQPEDLPPDSAQDILPGAKVESFRLLGVIDEVDYFAAVRPGADDPWCLLAVSSDAPAAVCANRFPITIHSESGSVALYDEAPQSGGPWTNEGTSFWSSTSR